MCITKCRNRSEQRYNSLTETDLRPLWLLVGTPSAIRPELAFSRTEHSLPYSDITIYFFTISYLSSMLYVYRFLWPLRLGWLLVWCLYKEVYLQIFKRVSFWLHGCWGSGKVGPVNQVNHTSWVAVVTPTVRPKSVRNRCLIELFCSAVYVVILPFWHFRWCRALTESDLLLFVMIIVARKREACRYNLNVTGHSGWWPHTVTPYIDRT